MLVSAGRRVEFGIIVVAVWFGGAGNSHTEVLT